jgi:HEPN domain-containing protein
MNILQTPTTADRARQLSRQLRNGLLDYPSNKFLAETPLAVPAIVPALKEVFDFLDELAGHDIPVTSAVKLERNCTASTFPPWLAENKTVAGAVRFIVETIQPERIYCIRHEPVSVSSTGWTDLLVVLGKEHTSKPLADYETIIEAGCISGTHLSFSLHQAHHLRTAIEEAHIFYSLVCTPANLVYTNDTSPWPVPDPAKMQSSLENAAASFQAGFRRAAAFHCMAVAAYEKTIYELAAFFLQQAVELCYRALLQALLGCNKKTHSIPALKKYCRRCAPQFNDFFSPAGSEEKRLFDMLEEAYLGARYEEDFTVRREDIEVLLEMTRQFHQYAQNLVKDKLGHARPLASG